MTIDTATRTTAIANAASMSDSSSVMIASGIVEAIEEIDFKLPLVVRLQGTNAREGKDIINKSSKKIISIDDLTEAAKKVVELAN